jgi:hypothetical protein
MNDVVRTIVLGLAASAVGALAGWLFHTYLWRRALHRKQRFFGLPSDSECLLVVNRDPAAREWSVARHDVFALLELAALVKECQAHAEILPHDTAWQGFGARTEFCVGGPVSHHRMAAHLRSMLPGVGVGADSAPGPERGAFTIGGEIFRMERGSVEYMLLARLAAGRGADNNRPVFLASGQCGVASQAAIRYLARHQGRLARKYGSDGTFCLLLKVVNSQAYGPDVVELVSDVTRAASAAPTPAKVTAPAE